MTDRELYRGIPYSDWPDSSSAQEVADLLFELLPEGEFTVEGSARVIEQAHPTDNEAVKYIYRSGDGKRFRPTGAAYLAIRESLRQLMN